jgi:phosphatidylglycerol:prolipoprotein diacylglycerol transferase
VVSAAFLIFYGTIRFFIEFYRQPDAHIGYVALEWLSMGQLLCLPMILAGLLLLTYFLRKA